MTDELRERNSHAGGNLMMKKNQARDQKKTAGVNEVGAKGVTLQVTKLHPVIYQQLLIYEMKHGKMEHHEVLEAALPLLEGWPNE